MPTKEIKNLSLFYHPDSRKAATWAEKIKRFLRRKYPAVKINKGKPKAVIVIGGDGTIIDAARQYQRLGAIIFGMNLGHVGFLASVRESRKFLSALNQFLKGNCRTVSRMMIAATVKRGNKVVFESNALNEVVIQNPLGILELEVDIEGHPVQYIRGTGVLVATGGGSTAYNLSAHGPIVMPDIKCMIVTELMDHNIPTPSIVVKRNREVSVKIKDFRKRGLFSLSKTGEKVDVIMIVDGDAIFTLERGDVIKIRRSPRLVKFVELEKHYFFKSLQEKFAFK